MEGLIQYAENAFWLCYNLLPLLKKGMIQTRKEKLPQKKGRKPLYMEPKKITG